MKITIPKDSHHLKQRNQLLQAALRDEPLPFSIAKEYPIVLKHPSPFSYCMIEDDQVIAHANLWPRILVEKDHEFPVALIGNVATAEAQRGRGIMRQLLLSLEEIAVEQGLAAMFLWSDLSTFYQKQGYEALGKEVRFLFNASAADSTGHFLPIDPRTLDDRDLATLLSLRFPTNATLKRSVEEFRTLLDIPSTRLFAKREDNTLVAYGIVGKGYDMQGVIHEWGTRTPEEAFQLVRDTQQTFGWPECMLLAPGSIDPSWIKFLSDKALSTDHESMALAKAIKDSAFRRCLDGCFIWGLDSI